jgi:hypothetical protein
MVIEASEIRNPTIVQVQLDVDIVEEEIVEFYIEILEYVDKHDHVIPIMDILDRITIRKDVFALNIILDILQLIFQVVIIFPIVMLEYYSF